MTQYAKIARKYSDGTRMEHPQRKYLLYPTWLNVCGNIHGVKVLDVGCGGGDSSRLLAEKGAQVLGIDKEMKLLRFALQSEQKHPLGIKYQGAEAEYLQLFLAGETFDLIAPTYLLHYAKSKKNLSKMISSMFNLLNPGGRIIAILSDPEKPVIDYYPGLCTEVRWVKNSWKEGSELMAIYRDGQGNEILRFKDFYWWKKETYESILKKAGFTGIRWIKPRMNQEGKKLFPNWKKLEDYPITIISAHKKL